MTPATSTWPLRVVDNAKTQKYSPCNATESLLVAKGVAADFLPRIGQVFAQKGVEMRCCPEALAILERAFLQQGVAAPQGAAATPSPQLVPATEQDWFAEYLAPIISIKVVAGLDEAIDHINHYSSHHTDAILTRDHVHGERFFARGGLCQRAHQCQHPFCRWV